MRPLAFLFCLALIALPAGAAIKAMNLHEYMEITHDTVQGTIVAKDQLTLDHPDLGSVYTRLTVEGTSLRTGEDVATTMVFLGSHEAGSRHFTSEMPMLRDVRLGNEVVLFYGRDPEVLDGTPGGANVIFSFAGVYRVERGFGETVVIGKGEGFAFPENTRLSDARRQVSETHQLILAERAKSGK
jgi:hypothetical protein